LSEASTYLRENGSNIGSKKHPPMMIALRLTVHGRVQGVFYRNWTVDTARWLGLAGWVRNCADGTVAAHVEGAEPAVRRMVELMHLGPPAAVVKRIDEEGCAPEYFGEFGRR
jgi:acylphosphatase